MRKTFYHIWMIPATLCLALLGACDREPLPEQRNDAKALIISPALLDIQENAPVTRADETQNDAQFNENRVARLDVFIFQGTTLKKDYHITTEGGIVSYGGKSGYLLSHDWLQDGLAKDVAYKVYVIANSTNASVTTAGAITAENDLKALSTEDEDIYKRYNADAPATDNTYSPSKTFLMNAKVDSWTITDMNTQLISGDEAPDMVLISGAVSPFPLIRHGLLRDLSLDLAEDPDMSLEDIVIGDAVIRDCGGLFLLSDSFSFMPRVALQSRFGQVWGWSFDQYLELARQTPEDRMVMYNLTRDYFLDSSLSRCLRQGIDWKAGTCDFDNPDFVAMLEACRDMKETPEDPNNMVFGGNLMAEGFMLTELTMLTDVTDLAKEQRRIGQPICVIGWPTLDGSCGEDFEIGQPIGVLNGTAHPERCWDFLKYCLNNPDSGIPVYRPLIERKLDEARHIDPNASYDYWYDGLRSPMTEEEIAFFRDFLAQVRHTDLRDETAMSIAKEEAQAFLAGQISAGEAASRVQKRMSIYVSEQG